jgi:tRNA modification GTPase
VTTDPQTIAALLTPLAPGAIAVVGLAGAATDTILDRILRFGGAAAPGRLSDRHPTFCRLADGSEVIDDAVVVRLDGHAGPIAEINTHGGVRVAQRVLFLLEKNGAVVVDADTWVGRCDQRHPVEREVDRAILDACSRRLTRWLLSQRRILPPYLDQRKTLDPSESEAFRQRSRVAIHLLQGLRVALIGPPNAGKSTLTNRLFGTDRVIASPEPGTTRDWVSETAFIRGWPVTLVDTAGIREATCAIEAEAVGRARRQAEQAELVVVVLDATTPAHERQNCLAGLLGGLPADQPRLVVINKSDVLGGDHSVQHGTEQPLLISAQTGMGIDDFEGRIAGLLGLDSLDDRLPTAFLPHQLGQELIDPQRMGSLDCHG